MNLGNIHWTRHVAYDVHVQRHMLQSMMSFTATEVHECASELPTVHVPTCKVPSYVNYISVLIY